MLLEVYGTHHDPELWENPEEFRPERFRDWKRIPFDFIPQGGGDHHTDHRCAG
ncbi:cytochrome P450 [Pontibacter qinzhouensis]|uniref:cytochrome P450 n=1 Tax=Pontibacter qinzhouensis TaxID=2603253 RepID=UPI001C9C6AD2|nr:cytochrome P450 [Pontibacter qinzhouensis]